MQLQHAIQGMANCESTICEFPCSSSTPFRFFRRVKEDSSVVILDYFDIDGTYIPG